MARITWLAMLGVVFLGLGLAGCATHTMSAGENRQRWAQAFRHDRAGLGEDFDAVCLKDRTSRLSRWHPR
ncbi:MAG TPA: hypothetical protein PKK06_03530 [Phycisphaerae bacterium]|nr:hypothetical protein [Phycisphaerae bacterium]HNU45350.1 hypothetical protein [Phycisphaerae bacterium]